MENRENQNPQAGQTLETGKDRELNQSQQQQPEYGQQQQGQQATGQAGQQQPTSQDGQQGSTQGGDSAFGQPSGGQSNFGQSSGSFDNQQGSESGQADYGSAGQSDTMTDQRSDVEGSSFEKKPETGEEDGFIGTQGSSDTSSELVEKDEGIPSDGE